jgi:hypothetical protein
LDRLQDICRPNSPPKAKGLQFSVQLRELKERGTKFKLCANFSLVHKGECESWVPILDTNDLDVVSTFYVLYSYLTLFDLIVTFC